MKEHTCKLHTHTQRPYLSSFPGERQLTRTMWICIVWFVYQSYNIYLGQLRLWHYLRFYCYFYSLIASIMLDGLKIFGKSSITFIRNIQKLISLLLERVLVLIFWSAYKSSLFNAVWASFVHVKHTACGARDMTRFYAGYLLWTNFCASCLMIHEFSSCCKIWASIFQHCLTRQCWICSCLEGHTEMLLPLQVYILF